VLESGMKKQSLMKQSLLSTAILTAVVLAMTAFAEVPEHPSSRVRDVPDRLEASVPWGSAHEIFDTLAARTGRGGYSTFMRNDEKFRLMLERPASAEEARPLVNQVNGSERIRMRFEITAPKKGELGHRVTGLMFLVQDPGGGGEKDVSLDEQQPYRDEMKAYLRGLEPDRLR